MDFKDRLTNLREQKKWTKKETAKKIGVTTGAYSNWEYGNRVPNQVMIQKIADVFSVSSSYLITGEKTISDLSDLEKQSLSKDLQKSAIMYKKSRDKYIQSTIDYFIDLDFFSLSDEQLISLRRLLDFIDISNTDSLGELSHLLQLITMASNEDKLHSDSFKIQYDKTVEALFTSLIN